MIGNVQDMDDSNETAFQFYRGQEISWREIEPGSDQPESKWKVDLISGFVSMDLLPRVRFLLSNCQIDNIVDPLLDILLAVVLHSPVSSAAIVEEGLLELVQESFIGVPWPVALSLSEPGRFGTPNWRALRLVRHLIASDRKLAGDALFGKCSLFNTMLRYVVPYLSSQRSDIPLARRMFIEVLGVWRTGASYGLLIDEFVDLCSEWIEFSQWFAVPEVMVSYYRLLEQLAYSLPLSQLTVFLTQALSHLKQSLNGSVVAAICHFVAACFEHPETKPCYDPAQVKQVLGNVFLDLKPFLQRWAGLDALQCCMAAVPFDPPAQFSGLPKVPKISLASAIDFAKRLEDLGSCADNFVAQLRVRYHFLLLGTSCGAEDSNIDELLFSSVANFLRTRMHKWDTTGGAVYARYYKPLIYICYYSFKLKALRLPSEIDSIRDLGLQLVSWFHAGDEPLVTDLLMSLSSVLPNEMLFSPDTYLSIFADSTWTAAEGACFHLPGKIESLYVAVRSKLCGRVPLPHDWLFAPVDFLYRTNCANQPDVDDEDEDNALFAEPVTQLFRGLLRLRNESHYVRSLDSQFFIVNAMKVFLLSSCLFLDKQVSHVLDEIFHSCVRDLSSAEFISSPSRTFLDFYRSFVEQFLAVSYCDPVFSKYLLVPLRMSQSVDYRLHFWTELGGAFHMVTLNMDTLKRDLNLQSFFYPVESSDHMLQIYANVLVSGQIDLQRTPLFYWLAVHHLSVNLFSLPSTDLASHAPQQSSSAIETVLATFVAKAPLDLLSGDIINYSNHADHFLFPDEWDCACTQPEFERRQMRLADLGRRLPDRK